MRTVSKYSQASRTTFSKLATVLSAASIYRLASRASRSLFNELIVATGLTGRVSPQTPEIRVIFAGLGKIFFEII